MSKAFTPPPTLSKDDIRRVADVRRDVWTGGFRGAVFGIFVGSTSFLLFRGRIPVAKRANVFMAATMGGGALASFLSALTAGKNSVQRIGDVFYRGAHEWKIKDNDPLQAPARSSYQQILHRNQKAIQDTEASFQRRQLALQKPVRNDTVPSSSHDENKFDNQGPR